MTKTLLILSMLGAGSALLAQGPTTDAAFRFLGQASWGPTAASVTVLHNTGPDAKSAFTKYITDQLDPTKTPISALDDVTVADPMKMTPAFGPAQAQFLFNAVNKPDQLRQRVAFALSQIWVVSGVKINQVNSFLPYYRILLNDASKTYYDVMADVTLNPAMGHYLDMVNNDRTPANSTNSPNENYAREILQLFTLGTQQLNEDGSVKLNKKGQPIDAYSQDVIEGLAHVFTGWTYGPLVKGTPVTKHNPANYAVPMAPVEALHDTATKLIVSSVGKLDPATGDTIYEKELTYQGSAEKDLAATLTELFHNPNLPPFVCKQLIQHLVTSNPSKAYVQRVVNVFKNNGKGVRGDMTSVVEAILLDTEARAGDAANSTLTGHMREPVLYIAGMLRSLNVPVSVTNTLAGNASSMGQNLFFAPTVFNYFAPNYTVPNTGLLGPEFQIYSPSTAMIRADFVNSLVYGTALKLDTMPFESAAAKSVAALETLIDTTLLPGTVSSDLKASIEKVYASILPTSKTPAAIASANKAQAQAALYLALVSPEYQVQR